MHKKILLICFFSLIFINSLYAQTTQQLNLKQGFNFVSFKVTPSVTPVQFLTSNANVVEDIYLYSAAAGSFLSVSENTLTNLSAGKGYIIKSKSNTIIELTGSTVSTIGNISLKSGFNLVGFSKAPEKITFSALINKYQEIKGIYKWSSAAGSFIQVIKSSGEILLLDGVDPEITETQSYFVNIENETKLNYDGIKIIFGQNIEQPIEQKTATPMFTLPGGTYSGSQQVVITCSTQDAIIKYTLDGSDPSLTNGLIYSTPITISITATIKTIAIKTGMLNSDIAQAIFTILPKPSLPQDTLIIDLGDNVTLEMVKISNGTFSMGDINGFGSEKVTRQITISKDFYIAKYETTQRQWEKIMGSNPSNNKANDNPVECVSYNEICKTTGFLDKINQLKPSGYSGFRLPTEAEWEYACRAGTTTKYYWGDEFNGDYVWYETNSGEKPQPVGKKLPNQWGLYDMIGNVWEWCNDWYGPYQINELKDPAGPLSGTEKIIRGSSCTATSPYLSSAVRNADFPDKIYSNLGFRLCMSSDQIQPIKKVDAPIIAPRGGVYNAKQNITINCNTENAVIIYTTDGSIPSINNGLKYGNWSVEISSSTKIKVMAMKYGMLNSDIVEETYKIQVSTPVISVSGGSYASVLTSIKCPEYGVTIKYTTDGSMPSKTNGITYEKPIKINSSSTLKAIAIKDGFDDSEVTSATYAIKSPEVLPIDLGGGVILEMIKIPAGTFVMGNNQEYNEYYTAHQVTLTESFYIGKFEITQAQWQKLMNDNPSKHKKGGNYPVDSISWNGSQEFITKLNQIKPGGYSGFRLPTEAEWEYACRSGSNGDNYWEDENYIQYCWHSGNTDYSTEPVGGKLPNNWGLFDMCGNVSEWCNDWYGPYSIGAYTDPQGAMNGSNCVVRGGSYYNYGSTLSSFKRYYGASNLISEYVSFRLVLAKSGEGLVDRPFITPNNGLFEQSAEVSITCNTPDAKIYYTIDNTHPSNLGGIEYKSSFYINRNVTLRAVAIKNGVVSPERVVIFSRMPKLATPSIYSTPSISLTASYDHTIYTAEISISNSDYRFDDAVKIYYTTDGSNPSRINGKLYQSVFVADKNSIIKAMAVKNGAIDSDITSLKLIYAETIQAPQITPGSGLYKEKQLVSISNNDTKALIYYTLDGTTPTIKNGILYESTIEISTTSVLKAIAIKDEYSVSKVSEAKFTINKVATPVITPEGGIIFNSQLEPDGQYFTLTQEVTISSATEQGMYVASIYYTIDGSEPTDKSYRYTSPLLIGSTVTIKARAYFSGYEKSDVATAYFEFKSITPSESGPVPIIKPAGSSLEYNVPIEITCSDPQAQIYYLINNSTVAELYNGPFQINSFPAIIRASSIVPGKYISKSAKAFYINGTPKYDYVINDVSIPEYSKNSLVVFNSYGGFDSIGQKTGLLPSNEQNASAAPSEKSDVTQKNQNKYKRDLFIDAEKLRASNYKAGSVRRSISLDAATGYFNVFYNSFPVEIEATKIYDGPDTKCAIYCETKLMTTETQINKIKNQLSQVGNLFDSKYFPLMAAEDTLNYKPVYYPDVDKNKKIVILYYDMGDSMRDTMGYFLKDDLKYRLYSNNMELLYLNYKWNTLSDSPTDICDPLSKEMLKTIPHEFQHLLNAGRTVIDREKMPFPTWIEEGLALSAQQLCFNDEPETYYIEKFKQALGRPNFKKSLIEFNEDDESYALSYIFMQYCKGITNIRTQLLNSDRWSGSDYKLVESVISKSSDKYPTFATLLADFWLAVFTNSDGVYGFGYQKDVFNFSPYCRPYMTPDNSTEVTLLPAEAIYITPSNKDLNLYWPKGSESDIRFIRVNRAGQ